MKIATVAVVIAIFIIEDLDVDLSDNVSVHEKSKEKLIQQSRDESSQSNDPVQVYGAGLNAGERQADCPQCKEQIAGYDEDQQVHLNLTEFHEHAEQRAMQAALRKRAAKQKSLSSDHAPGKHPNASSSVVPYSDPQSVISQGGISKTSGGAFKGIHTTPENAHLFQFENITYLSFMLYRLIKTHDIKSVVDVPCTQSILWLPDLLQRLEFEIPHFHYRCIVPNDEYLVDAVLRFKDLSSTTVVKDTTFWTAILPKADLAVSWYGVGYVIPRISWQLLKSVRQSQTKYIIVPNHPKVKSNPSSETKHGRVNVRKPPYLFDEPFRVVKNLSVSAGSPKELMMYKVDAVRKGVI